MKYYAEQAANILRDAGIQGLYDEFLDSELYREIKFRTATRRNQIFNRIKYIAPADPYRLVSVDPNSITKNIIRSATAINKLHQWDGGLGQVRAWNAPTDAITYFSEHYVKRGFVQRFDKGYDWTETVYYQELIDSYDEQVLRQRCAFYDQLYKAIRTNGYKRKHTGPTYRGSIGYKQKLSILVVIAPEGEIYLWDGRHRLAIAQLLDLKTVPVHVVCRHQAWQSLRDQVHRFTGSSTERPDLIRDLSDHPDLQDIID